MRIAAGISRQLKMSNHVRAAEMILKRVGIAVLLTVSSLLFAAQQDSQSMIAAIKVKDCAAPKPRSSSTH
jgi:hypothetical protein